MTTLTYSIQTLFLTTSIAWVIARLLRYAIYKQGSWARALTLLILCLFLWFLIHQTLEPYSLVINRFARRPNLIPLKGLVLMVRRAFIAEQPLIVRMIVLVNILGNVLIFVPIGFLASVLTPLRHKGWLSFTLGLTISLTIEILQLGFLIRVFDVDDLILNSIGAWLGFLVFLVLSQIKPLKAYFERIASAQRPHAWLFVLLYGAFVAATAAGIYWRDYNAYLQIPQ